MANNKTLNTVKICRTALIVYAAIVVVGIIVAAVFGLQLDINFSGGTRLGYSYTGEIDLGDVESTVGGVITQNFTVSQNTSLAGDTTTITVSLIGHDSLSAETQEAVLTALTEKYPDNDFTLYDSNSVSPTIAGSFFLKSLVAVILTAVFVILYVGIRFRKIGGVSAALTALITLVLDILITFFVCVFFRLQIDANYLAVVLTILGYSLNDTIVVYDRVRENKKLHPELSIRELVNESISSVKVRNYVTTLTTLLAVFTIIVISELYGLTSLRTFAIPMAFGLLSGCVSSLFVAGPLWVLWKEHQAKRTAEK